MTTNNEKTPWWKWLLIVASLITATSGTMTFGMWLFQEKIVNFVVEIYNEQKAKEPSFIVTMAEKMSKGGEEVKPEDVCWKLAKAWREFNSKSEFENDLLEYWIPHLEHETEWHQVGYFVNMNDPTIVKFHHWDGRDYDAWSDEQGWFYVKGGFKFYN